MVAYGKPCERCGWKFKTFHICLDLPLHIMRRVEDISSKKKKKSSYERDPNASVRGSDEWRAKLSASRQAHAARLREENRERDEMIVERYSEDEHTIREIAEEFHLSYPTVYGIIHRAAEEGDVILRHSTQRVRS